MIAAPSLSTPASSLSSKRTFPFGKYKRYLLPGELQQISEFPCKLTMTSETLVRQLGMCDSHDPIFLEMVRVRAKAATPPPRKLDDHPPKVNSIVIANKYKNNKVS
jgi:hypothetical protein